MLLISTLVITLLMTSVSVSFGASKKTTIRRTVYDHVLKSGNTVYVAGGQGLYKVKLSNGAAVSSNLIYHTEAHVADETRIWGMHKKGNYIYFMENIPGAHWIMRVNTNTFKQSSLYRGWYLYGRNSGFVIKKNKILS